ncbi:hypothetical protein GCM10010233_18310 [Streptomyces pseudogriseolus]|uniref:Uncharacterized protein n=1 Tax=Streptomyces pseudogriseolus TaxID=36817 RepID=A0ABQ2SW46_STREZ|nr:hypothetical protein GCM10010233_18310 [Streptomyces gancidicus]GGS41906.1 hypothetical protein GCM10010285_21760 [Streptomyces rubiginosus]
MRGTEGAVAAFAGLEGRLGRTAEDLRGRRRAQRGFPDAEREDARRAGQETAGEPSRERRLRLQRRT